MKLKIEKILTDGNYMVHVETLDFNLDEKNKISKFGSPLIALEPKFVNTPRGRRGEVPVHAISYNFNFDNEGDADNFVNIITDRIKQAMNDLRAKEDRFTNTSEYDI